MRDIDPDSEESQAATRQNEREVFALQMQAKADATKGWWCPNCRCFLKWDQVTYEETHDERYGGCGETVLPEQPSPAVAALCRVGVSIYIKHDIGLDGACTRCGARLGVAR